MKRALFGMMVAALGAAGLQAAGEVTPGIYGRLGTGPRLIRTGALDLVPGGWRVLPGPAEAGIHECYLVPDPREEERPERGAAPGDRPWRHTLVIVTDEKGPAPAALTLTNGWTGESRPLAWPLAGAPQEDAELARERLDRARRGAWRAHVMAPGSGSILETWLALTGVKSRPDRDRRRQAPGTASAFDVLGGRAAVAETLQMQALNPEPGDQARTIPLASIPGVAVHSHPYGEMIQAARPGELALARGVPTDRFFLHAAKPEALLALLDEGADFLSRAGGAATGHSLEYGLTDRYLARLGVPPEGLRALLAAGLLKEAGFFAPDLFFVDGTEVTALCRLAQPAAAAAVSRLFGVPALAGEIAARRAADGRESYWTLRQDILVAGTSRAEVEAAAALLDAGGAGSLGASDEFRYMLSRLAPDDNTRLFAYFSDAFIRRLVGPEVKIGQLRRVQARAEMEWLTAAGLLARLNGEARPDRAALRRMFPDQAERLANESLELTGDGLAISAEYGTLAEMKSLLDVPVGPVTAAERDAYAQYRDNYSRFWSQFFDPIAIRLNAAPDGGLEAELFILPLVENSLYEGVREVIATAATDRSLTVPRLSPEPAVLLSVNLSDEAREGMKRFFSEEMMRELFPGFSAQIGGFGSGLHLAILDADPVLALGAGDLLGAFGGDMSRFGRNEEMLIVPILLSVLTRPCAILLELREPARTAAALRQVTAIHGGLGRRRNWDGLDMSLAAVAGTPDSWLLSVGLEGIFGMRFGLEVREGYLVIRNTPWSNRVRVISAAAAPLNGAWLEAAPAACPDQAPGLYTSHETRQMQAALRGLAHLYPLVACGVADPDGAGQAHQRLFGFQPVHPEGGTWRFSGGAAESSLYGTPRAPRVRAFDPARGDFGVLRDVARVRLNMQFEDSGLRAVAAWSFEPPVKP